MNRITPQIIDDSNFAFLETGTYPTDYIGLCPMVYYQNYYSDNIAPLKSTDSRIYTRYNLPYFLNVNSPMVIEYWEKVPKEILSESSYYPDNIYASSFGRIYNRDSKILYTLHIRKDGYVGFKNTPVHRIILYTFCPIENYKDMTVDHKSFNVTENYLWNLQWKSLRDNINRSYPDSNNLYFKSGERNIHSTMSDYEAELVCAALATHKYNYDTISKAIGVSKRAIKHIADLDSRIDLGIKYGLDEKFDYRSVRNNNCTLPLYGVIHR